MIHLPVLGPSEDLFNKYLHWRDNNKWNKKTFESEYKPQFIREFNQNMCSIPLRKIINESKDKNIALACFCKNEELCHMKILAEMIEIQGIPVYHRY